MELESQGGLGAPNRDRRQHVRSDLPPRVRTLLDTICSRCDNWVEPVLRDCIQRLDQRLYEQAEQSREHLVQQRCFESRHLLSQSRDRFLQAFVLGLRDAFTRMGVVENSSELPQGSGLGLTLLDPTEQELSAAVEKLASRGESANGLLLSDLSYRMAVLVAAPPLEGKALPFGPHSLAQVLRDASDVLLLPTEDRLLLLNCFDQAAASELPRLFEAVNAELLNDGILPQLRPFPAARPSHGPAHANGHGAARAPGEQTGSPVAESHEPIAVLENLRDLLAHQRMGHYGVAANDANARVASIDELQTALSALQQHMVQLSDHTSRELRSAQLLHEELLRQLNQDLPAGAPRMRLSAEQNDTVSLVALLFDQLSQQLHHGQDARNLLGGLQLPLLRLAMDDRSFFDQHEHPARQWLDKLGEAIEHWLGQGDGDTDQQLLGKLRGLVERTQREAPSAGLYTSLVADIEHHLGLLARKAQQSERRHVEAMQGRERLEQARRRADALMRDRFAIEPPRGLLRALLDRAWTDVLALYLLRHNEDSDAFRRQLEITDQLLGRLPVPDPLQLRQDVQAGLQQIGMSAVEAEQVALRLIGAESLPITSAPAESKPPVQPNEDHAASPESATVTPGEDTPAPVAETPAPVAPASIPDTATPPEPPPRTADAPSATDLALRLKQRHRLGEQRSQEPPAPSPVPADAPLGIREGRIFNRLRQLPYGTWFEFTDPATGNQAEHKLAWFSPVSGNSLFVNRRGQRSEVMNLRTLARAIAQGRVRELPTPRSNILDRAWNALTASLLKPASPLPPEHP